MRKKNLEEEKARISDKQLVFWRVFSDRRDPKVLKAVVPQLRVFPDGMGLEAVSGLVEPDTNGTGVAGAVHVRVFKVTPEMALQDFPAQLAQRPVRPSHSMRFQ